VLIHKADLPNKTSNSLYCTTSSSLISLHFSIYKVNKISHNLSFVACRVVDFKDSHFESLLLLNICHSIHLSEKHIRNLNTVMIISSFYLQLKETDCWMKSDVAFFRLTINYAIS